MPRLLDDAPPMMRVVSLAEPNTTDMSSRSPPETSVLPRPTRTSAPLKSRRVMMLTTPPMASEPYTAEAPSDRISMRSTAASGMAFRSEPEDAACGAVGVRRPSIRTSVRPEPRPRRSTLARDCAELPDCGRKLPNEAKVESRSTSATDTSPLASIWARSITTTGTAPSISARFRREPVTSTVSRVAASASASVVVSCANAGSATKAEAAPARSAKRIAPDN